MNPRGRGDRHCLELALPEGICVDVPPDGSSDV